MTFREAKDLLFTLKRLVIHETLNCVTLPLTWQDYSRIGYLNLVVIYHEHISFTRKILFSQSPR